MATRLTSSTFGYQNFYSATLSGDITSGTLTIGVSTVPTPTAGILVIDPDSTTSREVILYTTKGASTVTCPSDGRGYSGSTAAAHLQGTSVIMAPVDKWFTALASGELSSDPLRTELFFDYVASGCVWSGDAYASTRAASMTSGVIYIAGKRLTLVAVSARTFTASKDTYIDASDNSDGTALLTYTEVTNNAASPALATNNVRVGIIVTGATTIAAAGSVNQGQETIVLPIASSIPYTTTDSLGNLICPRDPQRKTLGYRQIITTASVTTPTTAAAIPGLTIPVIIPAGRKARVSLRCGILSNSGANFTTFGICVTSASDGNRVQTGNMDTGTAINGAAQAVDYIVTGTGSLSTYVAYGRAAAGNVTYNGSATSPDYIMVELI